MFSTPTLPNRMIIIRDKMLAAHEYRLFRLFTGDLPQPVGTKGGVRRQAVERDVALLVPTTVATGNWTFRHCISFNTEKSAI